jgi:Putative phage metallopeptidase
VEGLAAGVIRVKKLKKPKRINFEMIPGGKGSEPHRVLRDALEHHDELEKARIGLAWRRALKPDKDGHLVLGKCVKISDLQHEMVDLDFVVLLNKEVWQNTEFTDEKKLALMDHELCHAAPVMDDETDEQKMDEKGRLLWRVRKHDIEEFQDVVQRHGCYKRDLENFARALAKSKQAKMLFDADEKAKGTAA